MERSFLWNAFPFGKCRSRSKESLMGSGESKPPSVSAAFIFAPSSGLHPRGWSFHPQPYEFILTESSRWYGTVSFLYQSQDSRLTPSRRSCCMYVCILMVEGLSSAFPVKKTGSCPSSLPYNTLYSITIYFCWLVSAG